MGTVTGVFPVYQAAGYTFVVDYRPRAIEDSTGRDPIDTYRIFVLVDPGRRRDEQRPARYLCRVLVPRGTPGNGWRS